MARNVTVVIEGKLLRSKPTAVGAIVRRAFKDLAEDGADQARNKLVRSGSANLWGTVIGGRGSRSGSFRDSIHGELHDHGLYADIKARKDPPIQTWLERGTRRGVKLRTGNYFFKSGRDWVAKNAEARISKELLEGFQ